MYLFEIMILISSKSKISSEKQKQSKLFKAFFAFVENIMHHSMKASYLHCKCTRHTVFPHPIILTRLLLKLFINGIVPLATKRSENRERIYKVDSQPYWTLLKSCKSDRKNVKYLNNNLSESKK